ncbi:hypothetical protein [Pelotomaculum propionicicum]|nr:hypothetical protein [Pelotomaculum propionicicum]
MSGKLKIPFFKLGSWRHPVYGVIEGTQNKFDSIIGNFRRDVLGRPPYVRLGHTKDGTVTFGDAPAEAWVHDIIQEGDTLFALAHPTNDEVVDAVKSKRYRFASPEYQDHYINKETGSDVGPTLIAIGLTNEPFLTRLPDTVALADPPGTIYLDYEEVKKSMGDEFIKKLSEAFTKFFEGLKPAPVAGGLTDEERKKLAEIDTLKVQLADAQRELSETKTKLGVTEMTAWENQIDARLKDLVGKGIPPVMCDAARTILLANPAAGTTMIKLADNKEISLAEQVFSILEALPEEHRIKLAQVGSQESTKPGSPEEIKKMADADVIAMGGKITADGKYIL